MRHASLFTRLVRNTEEPESNNGCWMWTGRMAGRYPRFNIRDGEGKHRQLRAHRAMLVLSELEGETDLFWQVYTLYSLAELECDHLCWQPRCINPDHLQWLTPEENRERKYRAS